MPQTQSPTLSIGTIFQGGYEILSELGVGSFGRVYKARQLSTGQEVAIKILRFRDGDSAAEIGNQTERFRREMRLCAELSHPNMVRLIDSGEADDGMLYAVFEFVPGATLKDILAAEGKLGMRETLHLMTQVLDALSCAHARGVVHRDLKPENIIVTKTGLRRNALVLDFGLGGLAAEANDWRLPRLTATSEMMGTPCYAAPEQLRGDPPSTRSDLYSWGLIFLECLTGELPVGGRSAHEVVLKQLGADPVPIPAWLRTQPLGRLLEVVTAKPVKKRDVTLEGLLQTLDHIALRELEGAPAAAKPAALPEGERRQLTVMCCRLTVSDLEGDTLDLEEFDEILHAQHAIYKEHAARNGGHIASVMADRVLLVFGYPQAREDDARRAARTALQIAAEVARRTASREAERERHLQVHIGIHTGLVIVRELRRGVAHDLYDVVGLTPQTAARLAELAGPGQVLVSRDTQRLLRDEISSKSLGESELGEGCGGLPVFRLTGEQRAGAGLETITSTRETPLVGRSEQLSQLLQSWERTQGGRGGAVLIRGEPGMGKSRLVRELRRRVPADAWLECRCVLENQDSPLRPIVDLLATVEASLESLLTRYGFDLPETLPLFAALLSQPLPAGYAPLQLSPDRQKELTMSAIQLLLLRMGEARPLVFAIEDLHWADPSTLELIALLVQEVRTAQAVDSESSPRVSLVFTARPEFTAPWSIDDMSLIQLPPLTRQDVEQMITTGLTVDGGLPGAVLDQVVRRSDGVPLFVEEVTRMLTESATLLPQIDGLIADGSHAAIPGTLRDLLTARLDGLSPLARDTAQLAAVLGREFRYELLSTVSRKDESSLREDLSELVRAGLVYRRRTVRPESYVFKHALLCDTAYESLVKPRRQSVHQRIANTLRHRFPEIEQNRPEILAQHFERGGEIASAVDYWHRAGSRALARAAYVEAMNQLDKGLALLQASPESPERNRQEIELLTTLGTVFFSSKGYGAPEVEQTFTQARALCEQLGEDIPLKVLHGIWIVHIARGDREATTALVPRFRRLAERSDDPVASLTGDATLGVYAFYQGEFASAREHLTRARRLYGTEAFQSFARNYGYDGGLYCFAYEMYSLWTLGYLDQAEALSRELLSIADKSGNPFSISMALAQCATLSQSLGDTDAVLAMTERLVAVATEQHLFLWLAAANCCRGAALAQRGSLDEAIGLIQQGLSLNQMIGLLANYSFFLTYLAGAYLMAGRAAEGLAVVDEGLAGCETLVARFHESELLRLKGDLLFLQGESTGAEACLRRALEVAHRQQALIYELRAAMSFSRLLRTQGKGDEGRALLGGVYGRFSEGFGMREMFEAKALLAELL